MADLLAISEAMATALDTIEGLRAVPFPTGQIQPPTAIVGLPEIEYDATMARGEDTVVWNVALLVSTAYNRAAIEQLMPYIATDGATSVKATLEGAEALDGLVNWLVVTGHEAPQDYEYGGVTYFGVRFAVEVSVS